VVDPKLAAFPFFSLLTECHEYFIEPHKNFREGEKHYQPWYESLMKHEAEWTAFLSKHKALVWAERSMGMLGTYATLLRQRGCYQQCKAIVDGWYTKVMGIYRKGDEADQ
jgi:hypothetical protein